MLRGVTEVSNHTIKKESNNNVGLYEENMPPHMHNSGITKDAQISNMAMSSDDEVDQPTTTDTAYAMFYNDSFSTGVDENEMNGVVDEFEVQQQGDAVYVSDGAAVFHDNMPEYHKFYAFLISKNI